MRNRKNSTKSLVHDTDRYLQSLMATNPLQEPIMRRAIRALNLPPGSQGLDVGCGIGLQAIMLAEAVGAAGHVTGVDRSPEFLDCARSIAEKAGISEQVSFQEGDMNNLQFDDDAFDWVWSANCAGYAPGDPLPLLKELARVVKPGGSVIILAWSSQQLLPGCPVLEARLNATSSGIAPFAEGVAPERHFPRMMGWFRRAGMDEVTARTFAGDVFAPLSGEIRDALTALLGMRWVDVEAELSEEGWVEYRRLCLAESPEFILDLPDYYAFYTYSMFRGRVVG
ncbi:MAG: methyltransferase type 11 [Candidatus Methanogaster sp.]|uniref:Methyltransferase type 11 n=1 Tax=Candidatus Methanogaster sp. TaxID=3386292 RepID=A0AC61L4U1_9EURY|nr:MAG: methyltransferase type 11 [ANME-2 cluster archaeon]